MLYMARVVFLGAANINNEVVLLGFVVLFDFVQIGARNGVAVSRRLSASWYDEQCRNNAQRKQTFWQCGRNHIPPFQNSRTRAACVIVTSFKRIMQGCTITPFCATREKPGLVVGFMDK